MKSEINIQRQISLKENCLSAFLIECGNIWETEWTQAIEKMVNSKSSIKSLALKNLLFRQGEGGARLVEFTNDRKGSRSQKIYKLRSTLY